MLVFVDLSWPCIALLKRSTVFIYRSHFLLNVFLSTLSVQAKKKGYITRTPKVVSYVLLIVASGLLAAFNDQHPRFVSQCFGFDQYLNYEK
jgi:hypothetical protein